MYDEAKQYRCSIIRGKAQKDTEHYIKMENVPGLVRLFNGVFGPQIMEDFANIGYQVKMKILSSDNYGVPQKRVRVIFVGVRNDIAKKVEFEYPTPTTGPGTDNPAISCEEAISDLDFVPDDMAYPEEIAYEILPLSSYQVKMREGSMVLYNHSITVHTERSRIRILLNSEMRVRHWFMNTNVRELRLIINDLLIK